MGKGVSDLVLKGEGKKRMQGGREAVSVAEKQNVTECVKATILMDEESL